MRIARRRRPVADEDRHQVRSCAVYEIDDRVLVRTVDRADGLGIERDQHVALDGFAGLTSDEVGDAVVAALRESREVARPTSWPSRSAYAQPLLAASPVRYNSYRAWQRAARYVSVTTRPDGVTVTRWRPEPGRGGWRPPERDGSDATGGPVRARLGPDASPGEIGAAVLAALAPPALRES